MPLRPCRLDRHLLVALVAEQQVVFTLAHSVHLNEELRVQQLDVAQEHNPPREAVDVRRALRGPATIWLPQVDPELTTGTEHLIFQQHVPRRHTLEGGVVYCHCQEVRRVEFGPHDATFQLERLPGSIYGDVGVVRRGRARLSGHD